MSIDHATLQRACAKHGQSHLLAAWDSLTPAHREELLHDLSGVPFDELPRLMTIVTSGAATPLPVDIQPPAVLRRGGSNEAQHRTTGEALLRAGQVAAFTVAGGQGTRLGYDGPKGAFEISPVRNKSLFQLFAEQVLATQERYGRVIPWYIMTSAGNDAATRDFFGRHSHFGLSAENVTFFTQGAMPAFSLDGRILLDQPHRVALAPDGHGGSLLAMRRGGVLADMARRGVRHISYFQVDNPLVRCLDPVFIGMHEAAGSEMSSKMVPKASDDEKVGVFAVCDGVLRVLEYSDLPAGLASARNADGSRRFDAGSIAIHLLSREFVERLTADAAAFALPWHRAVKKSPYYDPAARKRVEPSQPNAIKLESFVFDALPLARNPIILQTDRREEFSPVKNATGVDSIATSRHDISQRAARWLAEAGVRIPRRADGDFEGLFEISARRAMELSDLRGATDLPAKVTGEPMYLA